MEHTISVTIYGVSSEDFEGIKNKYDGKATKRPDGRYDLTIDLFKTTDNWFIEHRNAFVGIS